jgi:hypothetical protein
MINTTMKTSPTPAEQPKVAAPSQPPAGATTSEPEGTEVADEEEEDEENTAPPIKVGGEQVTEAYRLKIRKLMGL